MIETPPPVWLPPTPAIIRPAPGDVLELGVPGLPVAAARLAAPGIVTIAKPAGTGDVGNGDASASHALAGFDLSANQIMAAVMVPDNASNEINSVTIGGVTPTTLAARNNTGVSSVGLFLADGPFSGSTINVELSQASFGIRVVIWALSGADHTLVDFVAADSGTLAVPKSGAAFVAWALNSSVSNPNPSYTGVDDLVYASVNQSGQSTRWTGANAQAFGIEQPSLAVSGTFSVETIALWISVGPK